MWGVPFYLFGFAPFLFLQTAKLFDPLEEGCILLLICVCCSLLLISKANQLVGLTSRPSPLSFVYFRILYFISYSNCKLHLTESYECTSKGFNSSAQLLADTYVKL